MLENCRRTPIGVLTDPLKDAELSYRRVLEAYPADVEMRAGLGWSLLKLGKAEEAARELRLVLEVAPRHVSAKAGLDVLGQGGGRRALSRAAAPVAPPT